MFSSGPDHDLAHSRLNHIVTLLCCRLSKCDLFRLQAVADFKKQVVVDRVLQALTKSDAFVSALKPQLRQAQHVCLHLRVLGARAFLDHLHHEVRI